MIFIDSCQMEEIISKLRPKKWIVIVQVKILGGGF